jgi:hypothetical protein
MSKTAVEANFGHGDGHRHEHDRYRATSKIEGVDHDRFGDFDGFICATNVLPILAALVVSLVHFVVLYRLRVPVKWGQTLARLLPLMLAPANGAFFRSHAARSECAVRFGVTARGTPPMAATKPLSGPQASCDQNRGLHDRNAIPADRDHPFAWCRSTPSAGLVAGFSKNPKKNMSCFHCLNALCAIQPGEPSIFRCCRIAPRVSRELCEHQPLAGVTSYI